MSGGIATATSLTAWGGARPLADVVADAVGAARDGIVQLSIGARPDRNWRSVLGAFDVEWIGHHTVPLGDGRVLRPGADPSEMLEVLTAVGVRRYSAHPPARRHADAEELWGWAHRWYTELRRSGITFALETMYPPLDPADAGYGKGWHLSTPAEVHWFLDRCDALGWESPLVLDGAHLYIGRHAGVWEDTDVWDLVERCAATGACAEAHVSANDGVSDRHLAPGVRPDVDAWVWDIATACAPSVIVDEGRRVHRP